MTAPSTSGVWCAHCDAALPDASQATFDAHFAAAHDAVAHPGWREEACGRCRGYGVVSDYIDGDFNGAAPCDDCGESGRIFIHEASGTCALWPGGPLRGRVRQ